MKISPNHTSRNHHFQDLMLHRVHDILLVASPYDAFILEEDGRLTEQILHEYLGMNLSYAPRVWQANTASYAMDLLSRRSVDLVIVMMRISDMDIITFGTQVKEQYKNKPIILLAFDESEIKQLPEDRDKFMDNVFVWSGNASVFPAIIKHIEDTKNVKRDIRKGDVRSIIYIEDTPRYYSSILPLIYKETLFHTKQLIDKSLNNTQRLLHMRGRPKVLLAQDYEKAERYFKYYKNNVLGIISDIRFPKNGKLHSNAGILFAKYVHSIERSMPILLLSNEKSFSSKGSLFSHGDLCFSNMILSEAEDSILFIDPRGGDSFRTPYYDLAKISHSLLGGYDHIINNKASICFNSDMTAFLDFDMNKDKSVKDLFNSFLESGDYKPEIVALVQVSLFLSMLPLHIDDTKKVYMLALRASELISGIKDTKIDE